MSQAVAIQDVQGVRATQTGEMPSAISINRLLAVYAIVPISLLVIFLDSQFFNVFKILLPHKPEVWAIWIYIFGMPHVFGGLLMIADKEYLAYYGNKVWYGAVAILLLPLVLIYLVGFNSMFFVFTAMIVYHTIAQQFGIALIIGKKKPDWIHKANTIIGSCVGVMLFCFIYAEGSVSYLLRPYRETMLVVAWSLGAVVVALTAVQMLQTKEKRGRLYMAANVSLLLSMLVSYNYGLTALVVIMGRIVHEMTAWIIYASHDKNRNHQVMNNVIYRKFAWLKIDPYWMGITLAFAFGIAVTFVADFYRNALFTLIISFSLYHYWTECFIWKGNAPPKRYLKFV